MQVALFGFVGFDIWHSDFLGSFAWGVTVSLNSFSVVFSLDPFPLSGVACLEIRVGAVCRSRTVGFQLRFGSSGDSSLWVGSVWCCFFCFLGCLRGVRRCPRILSPWYFLRVICVCVVCDILKCLLEQMLGVEHRVCSRTLGRAGEVLLGLVESDVGHFCFWGSFPWGAMVSSDSSSVVFPLGLSRSVCWNKW